MNQKTTAVLILAAFAGIAGVVLYTRRSDTNNPNRMTGDDDVSAINPASAAPTFDTNMPPKEAHAVNVAMGLETNPANLIEFADSLLPYYPEAAHVLKTKASLLDPEAERTLTAEKVRKALALELSQLGVKS